MVACTVCSPRVVCMDEQAVQLLPATPRHTQSVDYELERVGTAAVFMYCEPTGCWREATARSRRTRVDWSRGVAAQLEGRYADCARVTVVLDKLNTHTKGAFYAVFRPSRARALPRRIKFCYTPKHGSWLNTAENLAQ